MPHLPTDMSTYLSCFFLGQMLLSFAYPFLLQMTKREERDREIERERRSVGGSSGKNPSSLASPVTWLQSPARLASIGITRDQLMSQGTSPSRDLFAHHVPLEDLNLLVLSLKGIDKSNFIDLVHHRNRRQEKTETKRRAITVRSKTNHN